MKNMSVDNNEKRGRRILISAMLLAMMFVKVCIVVCRYKQILGDKYTRFAFSVHKMHVQKY